MSTAFAYTVHRAVLGGLTAVHARLTALRSKAWKHSIALMGTAFATNVLHVILGVPQAVHDLFSAFARPIDPVRRRGKRVLGDVRYV